MNRVLALLVLTGASVYAQTYTSGDWQYTEENGEATITGYTGSSEVLEIPTSVNGVPVKIIGAVALPRPTATENTTVTSIIIPNGITSIGDWAFYGCTSLTNVTIGTTVTTIGTQAFIGCISLSSISIPNSVTNIGSSAFQSSGLTSVTVPQSVTSIGDNAFSYCHSLTNVTIPGSVTSLGSYAFNECSKLYYVFIPDSLMGIAKISGAPFPPTFDPNTTIITSGLINALANDEAFVTAVANKILSASNNYGLATKTEVGGAVTVGVQQVLSSPSDYNLFTTQQVQDERMAGQNDVLNTPNSFSLYTTNQIYNLGLGGIVLNRSTNNQLVLNYQVLQSPDLQNWSPYQQTELVISNAPSDKMFLRVQAVGQ